MGAVYSLVQHIPGLNLDRRSALDLQQRIESNGMAYGLNQQLPDHANPANLLMSTEEEEKRRIARELHDGLGQLLTSINLHVQQCLQVSDVSAELPQQVRESLHMISAMAKQAMGEMRGICSALRPAILDDLGVVAAIKWQCRQVSQGKDGLTVVADLDISESMVPERYKTAIYRIVQEALNNAVKYANAREITVSLRLVGEDLRLRIQDNGTGFDRVQGLAGLGMGLMSMRERAECAGGLFELQTEVGQGVVIRVSFPGEKVTLSG